MAPLGEGLAIIVWSKWQKKILLFLYIVNEKKHVAIALHLASRRRLVEILLLDVSINIGLH